MRLLRVVVLFLRDGEAGDARSRSPCAANSAKPPQPQPISSTWCSGPICACLRQRPVFAGLGGREVVLALEVQRGRVGHRPVQPGFVEAIAEVVVGVDVTPRAVLRVAVQPMAKLLPDPHQGAVLEHLRDHLVIGAEEFEEVREVRCLPLATQIGFADADVAAMHKAARKPEIVDRHLGVGSGRCAAKSKPPSVGKSDGEAAIVHAHRKTEGLPGREWQACHMGVEGSSCDVDGLVGLALLRGFGWVHASGPRF